MRFETKIAVVLRDDVPIWQRLNMTAFLCSGIAATVDGIIGEPYQDASDQLYLPMFRQPVLVFRATAAELRRTYDRARSRDIRLAIFTNELFETTHDEANRAAVRAVASADMQLAGLAMHADRKAVDAVVKGLALHD